MVMPRWNPWRSLSERPHLTLIFAPLPPSAGRGALLEVGDDRIVILDDRLGRRDRNAVLGHELIHDERGIFYTPDTPAGLVAKEESIVQRTNVRRLVPSDELVDLVERLIDCGDAVRAGDISDEFDVPDDVAAFALWLHSQATARRVR